MEHNLRKTISMVRSADGATILMLNILSYQPETKIGASSSANEQVLRKSSANKYTSSPDAWLGGQVRQFFLRLRPSSGIFSKESTELENMTHLSESQSNIWTVPQT